MNDLILKLKKKQGLTREEIARAMTLIMSGDGDPAAVADFLTALNDKGPSVEEITGAAQTLQKFSIPVRTRHKTVLDTCGTGGDKKHTFNISTIVAIVVAAAGVAVAKHGNRSVSSRCGSADILEGLGVKLDLGPGALGQCLDEVGLAFLFAQKLHPAMKNVAPVRKALGTETIFNILGPLLNPARATHQMVGVYRRELIVPMASVLGRLGLTRALVVHGSDGLDEITTTGKSFTAEWDGQEVLSREVDPELLGFHLSREEDLKGGDLEQNIRIVRAVLDGQEGPRKDIIVLNAAHALAVVGRVGGISEGIVLARDVINDGRAREKLGHLIAFTNGKAG